MTLRNKKGFTLIELLVVVSIISLLASVVLASVNSARSKGRDARRLEDLQQIRNALELYANDHNGSYPDLYSYNTYFWISDNNYPVGGVYPSPPCSAISGGLQGYLPNLCSYKDPSGNPYAYSANADGSPKLGATFENTSTQGTPFTYWNGTTWVNVAISGALFYEHK